MFLSPIHSLFNTSFAPALTDVLSDIASQSEHLTSSLPAQNYSDNFGWQHIAVIIYFTGIIIMLSRELLSYYRLSRLIAQSDKTVYENYTLCISAADNIAPFSWGRYLFLPYSSVFAPNDNILLHEQTHISRRHWLDILFADLFCTLLWYNPAAWHTRRLIKLNHEFEADRAVIRSGANTLHYQRLLLTEAISRKSLPHVSTLADGKHDFRKRILIMNQPRSSAAHLWIAAFTLPAIISAGLIISTPAYARFLSSISDIELLSSTDTSAKQAQQYALDDNVFPSEHLVGEDKSPLIK
ncbi:MAG: M56 family metallopeptidase, partial [Muribaculaceae bacterium]|nr:M56 family metallopeptidase [Muribaculaceae bacterium]